MGHNGIIAASFISGGPCETGLTEWSCSKGYALQADACNDSIDLITLWHDSGGSNPVNGSIGYTDENGCTRFNGGDKYYSDNGFVSFKISSTGVFSEFNIC